MEQKKLTVAETIKQITYNHITQNNGLVIGQAISAVGWVNNTVPNTQQGILELPMTDIAGSGIAVGAALVGRKPIFIVRFQDFMILNGSSLIFYAAKSKELHGVAAPVFIRAIASDEIGAVHSGVLHSIFMHFPGFKVCSPMTPLEYKIIWNDFVSGDDPMYVSEHRISFNNDYELEDIIQENADVTLYAVSAARFSSVSAIEILKTKGIIANLVHVLWLKPLIVKTDPLIKSKLGLVVDAGHELAGASQSIAYELHKQTGCQVRALGLEDKTKCLCESLKNKTPNAEKIVQTVIDFLKDQHK